MVFDSQSWLTKLPLPFWTSPAQWGISTAPWGPPPGGGTSASPLPPSRGVQSCERPPGVRPQDASQRLCQRLAGDKEGGAGVERTCLEYFNICFLTEWHSLEY